MRASGFTAQGKGLDQQIVHGFARQPAGKWRFVALLVAHRLVLRLQAADGVDSAEFPDEPGVRRAENRGDRTPTARNVPLST
jgi:hypothetical protein